jgi:hypothetical protein
MIINKGIQWLKKISYLMVMMPKVARHQCVPIMGGFENFEKISFGCSPMGHKKYDEIEFSHSEMKAIFNLVVNETLDLIVTQFWQTCNMRYNQRFMLRFMR